MNNNDDEFRFQAESLRAREFFTTFSFPALTNTNSRVEVEPGSQSSYNEQKSLTAPHRTCIMGAKILLLCSATDIFLLFVTAA